MAIKIIIEWNWMTSSSFPDLSHYYPYLPILRIRRLRVLFILQASTLQLNILNQSILCFDRVFRVLYNDNVVGFRGSSVELYKKINWFCFFFYLHKNYILTTFSKRTCFKVRKVWKIMVNCRVYQEYISYIGVQIRNMHNGYKFSWNKIQIHLQTEMSA